MVNDVLTDCPLDMLVPKSTECYRDVNLILCPLDTNKSQSLKFCKLNFVRSVL